MLITKNVYDLLKRMPPFVYDMRVANRAGKKSQTRRIEKEQGRLRWVDGRVEYLNRFGGWQEWVSNAKSFRCPYGNPDDVVYMREPLYCGANDIAYYKDTEEMARSLLTGEPIRWKWQKDVLAGMYMPKDAARSFFRYVDIRVERLKEISDADARAEGFDQTANLYNFVISPRTWYSRLWDEINAKRDYPWDSNPWVWVIGYEPFDLKEISIPNRTALNHPTLEENAIKEGGH